MNIPPKLLHLLLSLLLVLGHVSAQHQHHDHHHQQKVFGPQARESNQFDSARAAAEMSGPASKASLNVFKNPIAFFSNQPLTGYLRNGYCEVPPGDFGNHSVAAEVTEEFLDYTERQGNDLRIAGLRGGCKWCLCASRWKEAFDARKNDSDPVVPKVFLNSTNEKALGIASMEELKKFAKDT